MVEKTEEEADLFRGGPAFMAFSAAQPRYEGEGDEILERKKAWAELEREQAEVKRNIKSMMRTEPASLVIDDPSVADRVSNIRMQPQKYDTVEDQATEKRMRDQIQAAKPASPAQPQAKPKTENLPEAKPAQTTQMQHP